MHRERSRELADLSPGLLGDLGERPELRTGHPGAALDVLVVPPDGFHDYPELLEHFQHAPPLVPALRPCELIHICANIIWSIIVPSITTGRRSMKTRSEEHTSELQSPYVISYAVFCLKK